MVHMSPSKKYLTLTILIASFSLKADHHSECPVRKEFCKAYETTIGKIYLKDLSRAVLAGAVQQDHIVDTIVLGLPLLSVEEANEALAHLLYSLCHSNDLNGALKGSAIALAAAKATSYLVVALNNLGLRLPDWVRHHRDVYYHVVTLLKGATRNTLRGWLQELV